MCIRDSASPARVTGAAGNPRQNTLTAAAAGPGGVPVNAAAVATVSVVTPPPGRILVVKPVSYTHLTLPTSDLV